MDPTTPVAIIERAHTPSQRTTLGTVGSIVDAARAAGVGNPAVIVVGDVVSVTADALAGRAT
jgi:uroporphyrin-III C-methyltransferase/precorrin-2 dehydrogenase/sirohydrochlorin ferrochelatase